MQDQQTLAECGMEVGQKNTVELRIDVLKTNEFVPGSGLPPVMHVTVDHGPGAEPASYTITIDNEAEGKIKPFLGGFNSIATGKRPCGSIDALTVMPHRPRIPSCIRQHQPPSEPKVTAGTQIPSRGTDCDSTSNRDAIDS